MDYFLSELYPYYDIAIWSQTSWRWLELKVTELGMMTSETYKICFVLDKSNMFKVGLSAPYIQFLSWHCLIALNIYVHNIICYCLIVFEQFYLSYVTCPFKSPQLDSGYVKPLHLIWSKHPHWGKQNTVIVDDLERNFVLNPESGVLISAFYRHPPSPKKSHRSKPSSSSSSSSSSDNIVPPTSSFLPLGGYSPYSSDPSMSNGIEDRNQIQGTGQGPPQGEGLDSEDYRNDQELLLLSR